MSLTLEHFRILLPPPPPDLHRHQWPLKHAMPMAAGFADISPSSLCQIGGGGGKANPIHSKRMQQPEWRLKQILKWATERAPANLL